MMHKTKPGVRNQFLAAVTCNLIMFFNGIMNAWGGPNFILLKSNETPLESGPLSISEASLVVSIICVGALIGIIITAVTTERFGRKIPLLLLAVPQFVSKIIIYFCRIFTNCKKNFF